jgi:hypothetical protein
MVGTGCLALPSVLLKGGWVCFSVSGFQESGPECFSFYCEPNLFGYQVMVILMHVDESVLR